VTASTFLLKRPTLGEYHRLSHEDPTRLTRRHNVLNRDWSSILWIIKPQFAKYVKVITNPPAATGAGTSFRSGWAEQGVHWRFQQSWYGQSVVWDSCRITR